MEIVEAVAQDESPTPEGLSDEEWTLVRRHRARRAEVAAEGATRNIIAVPELFDFIRPTASFSPAGPIYRGQSDAKWGLVPGLFRVREFPREHPKNWDSLEAFSIGAFSRRAKQYHPDVDSTFSYTLVIAQHYGVPTRLLDWSCNPLVALFFAVCESPEVDGALFVHTATRGTVAGCNFGVRDIPKYDCWKLLPPSIDRRVEAQQSIFTIHATPSNGEFEPLDLRIEDASKGMSVKKCVIPKEYKNIIRMQLEMFGVENSTLFPGLDGIGRDVKWGFDRDYVYGWNK